MQNKTNIRIFTALAFLLLTSFSKPLFAQTFEEARDYAFNGEREKARSICRTILSDGFNSDVALLMGRTFAWDKMYDSARVVLEDVLIQIPGNIEAYDALSDVEFWAGDNSKALVYCNQALILEPNSEKFTLKKAKILADDDDFDQAVNLLENYIHENSGNAEMLRKLSDYRVEMLKNNIRIIYTVDFFEKDFNRDPWHLIALSYGHKTKIGSIIGRVNYAQRYGNNGLQYEIDAYPRFNENNYLYLNYGFSDDMLFPKNRFGVEWYHNFPAAFEGSIGARLLQFESSDVAIYTATFGKYLGSYWVSLRSFVTPDTDGTSVAGFLLARRYFSDAENYIGMRLGYGVSPDDRRNFIESEEKLTVKTRSVKIEFNHLVQKKWIFNASALVGDEEVTPGKYLGYTTLEISVSRLF